MIRVSIIIPIFESYEIFRRQVLYLNSLGIKDCIEFIFADDGSNPKVILYDEPNFIYKLVHRKKNNVWTVPKLINYAVKFCSGQYIMISGIDHIISSELLEYAESSIDDYAVFNRKYALLNGSGELLKIQIDDCEDKNREVWRDIDVEYASMGWMKRAIFEQLGGYDEMRSGPNRWSADSQFFRKWCRYNNVEWKHLVWADTPYFYMLPEKKIGVYKKGRKRNQNHWKWLSHLRPVHMLHRLPDRDKYYKLGCEIPFEYTDLDDKFRFVDLSGTIREEYKYSNLICWKHPAEVRWMLGEFGSGDEN